jgi:hypothetical protein
MLVSQHSTYREVPTQQLDLLAAIELRLVAAMHLISDRISLWQMLKIFQDRFL